MSDAQSVSRNSVHSAIAWCVPVLLGFVATPLLVSALGVSGYGIYALVISLIQYSFNLQFGRLMTHYVARAKGGDTHSKRLCTSTMVLALLVSLLGAGAIAMSADLIVTELFRVSPAFQSEAIQSVRISALVLMSMAVLYLSWSVLQGLGSFAPFAAISGGYSVSISVAAILVAVLGGGINGILVAQFAVTVLFILLTLILLLNRGASGVFDSSVDRSNLAEAGRMALPVIGYQVIGNAVVLLERGMVSSKLGESALSFYVVAMNLAINLHGLAASLSLSILPFASSQTHDWESIRATYEKATTYTIALMTGLSTCVVMFAEQILEVWLGREFSGTATWVLIAGVMAFGLHSFSVVAFQVVDGTGRSRINLITTLVAGFIFAVVSISSIGLLGLEGPAIGRLASAIAWFVFMLAIDRSLRGSWGIGFFGGLFVRLAPAVIVSTTIALLVQEHFFGTWLSLLSGMLVSTLSFFFVALSTGVLRFGAIVEIVRRLLPAFKK